MLRLRLFWFTLEKVTRVVRMLLPHNTMAQMHFLQCLQIMWCHNFRCCSSYHEWVQKGLKVKHQANKLRCLVSVVLDKLQTMKIEQPGNAAQSELLQWPLGAGGRSGTCNHGPSSAPWLPSSLCFTPVHMQEHNEKWLFWLWKPGLAMSQMLQFLDMRRTLSIIRWSCLLSGTCKSMKRLFNSPSK